MALINTDWLYIDEDAQNIINIDNIDAYSNAVDEEIRSVCAEVKISSDDIPVDGSGYVTSDVLKRYGRYEFLCMLFRGYRGAGRNGVEDIYAEKANVYCDLAQKARGQITYESVIGVDDDGYAQGETAKIRQVVFYR